MCPAKEPGKEEMGFFPGPDTYQRWHFCLQSLCASVITLKSTKGSIDKHTPLSLSHLYDPTSELTARYRSCF